MEYMEVRPYWRPLWVGASGGLRCDPKTFSRTELQNLTRRYASELFPIIGQEKDILAPDVGTNAPIMAWLRDFYNQQVGYAIPKGRDRKTGMHRRLSRSGRSGVSRSLFYDYESDESFKTPRIPEPCDYLWVWQHRTISR